MLSSTLFVTQTPNLRLHFGKIEDLNRPLSSQSQRCFKNSACFMVSTVIASDFRFPFTRFSTVNSKGENLSKASHNAALMHNLFCALWHS